jgi:hypothetical protein
MGSVGGELVAVPIIMQAHDMAHTSCVSRQKCFRPKLSRRYLFRSNVRKYSKEIDTDLFEKFCPFNLHVFDQDATPRPVIRMVFALTSQESGVCFWTVDNTCGEFTAFDIWCTGLSCFHSVDKEDLVSYKVLLYRSLEVQHAFDLG